MTRAAFDLVIDGGQVIDGSGAPGVRADVGIRHGRITAIGNLSGATADRRLSAAGRVVSPGFIDIHSHSDFTLLVDPEARSAVAQGVTTEIVGNCGHGCAPLGRDAADDPRFTGNIYGWGPDVHDLDWTTVDGYLDAVARARPAINVGTLVPFGNLRLLAVDDVGRPADSGGMQRLARLLDDALDEGGLGLSTGLEYAAEHAASTEEIEFLCRRVASRDRLHAIHTRDRGRRVVEGTEEAVRIAAVTGVRTQVAHILARRGSGLADANARVGEILERAAGQDIPIAWDVHTRLFGITNLSTALDATGTLHVGPPDDTVIASFGRAGWDRTYLLDLGENGVDATDVSVGEMAAGAGTTPELLLRDVLRDAESAGNIHRPIAIGFTYEESDITAAIAGSRCAVASDGTSMNPGSRLLPRLIPGAFSWAAWFLRRPVRELGVLSLEEAIRRITSLPAAQVGLADRGLLRVGAQADVVVFDPTSITEHATLTRPDALATGVDHVVVNGVVTRQAGRETGARAGQVIRA